MRFITILLLTFLLSACNSDIFVEDFTPDVTELTMNGDGASRTIRFRSDDWSQLTLAGADIHGTNLETVVTPVGGSPMPGKTLTGDGTISLHTSLNDLTVTRRGDVVTVDRVVGTEMRYGLRFADVELSMPDRGSAAFPAKIMLETLTAETAGMSQDDYNRLYYGLIDDGEMFPADMPYERRVARLRDNPYWNALQVKYAYAATCHKAQGGQWSNVFVDLSYIPPEAMGIEFYRWLYTAVSRARSRLYLINPPVGPDQ